MTKFILALVVGLSALAGPAGATDAAAPPPAPGPSCSFERLPDDVDTTLGPDGVPKYAAWSQTPGNRQVLDSLHEVLDRLFGSPEAERGLRQLRKGLIGLVLDHREQRFVVVLSRHLKVEDYEEQIARMVPATSERGAAPVVVQHGCLASPALARTMDVVGRGKVVPGHFSARVDAATSRVLVAIADDRLPPPELTRLPGVEITHGDVGPRKGTRTADRSPHYGAASIQRGNGATCTSWATVRRPHGRRMGVTAAHCGANGSVWRSGKYFYGKARGKRNFPEQDSMRLHGRKGHGWRPRIHMNRGSRLVTGAGTPRVGDLVCKSGQTTGVVCGIEVTDTRAAAHYGGGVNHNLIFAEKPCSGLLGLNCPTVGQGGDSGGPVFKARANRRAGIRGMEVAGSARNNLYAEKPWVIQRHLRVKVLSRR